MRAVRIECDHPVILPVAKLRKSIVAGTWARLNLAAGSAVPAPGDDQSHVVALFLRTEAADAIVNGGDQISWRQVTMRVQRLEEPFLSELVVSCIERLSNPIRVDRQKISGGELELRRPALPRGEEA